MYVNRENFAKLLVEEGLASVHAYSAEKSGNANELFAAEQRAKEAKRGMWHEWDPSQEVEESTYEAVETNGTNGDSTPAERRKDYRDVMVTHVDPETAKLKLQLIGTGTAALTDLMSSFRNFHISPSANQPLPQAPKAGDFVSARFTEDDTWYRARIRRNDRENKTSEVVYVDFGNSETIPWSRLRALDQSKFGVQKLRPQAVDAVLSFLQFPQSPEYLRDSVATIQDMAFDRQLVANVDYIDPKDGTLHVTLFDPKESDSLDQSINGDIISEGFAMVPKKLKNWERAAGDIISGLKTRENEAKEDRRGMWE